MSTAPRSRLATVWLALAVVGYLAPGIPMLRESIETGNILFWTDPGRTTAELFVTRTSTAFALDLAAVVLTACIWIVSESRRVGIRAPWRFLVLTALFGLGGTLPLFLWFRERALGRRGESAIASPVVAATSAPSVG